MKDKLKTILYAVLNPPKWLGNVLGLLFVALCIAALLLSIDGLLAWFIYVLSAYGLYLLVRCAVLPLLRRGTTLLRRNPWINRYYTDSAFNARVILYRGFILNICYAVFKLSVGIWSRSIWFIAIAIYYIALCGIKFALVRDDLRTWRGKKPMQHGWRAFQTAGILLFLLNIALTGMIVLVVAQGNSYSYPGFIIFAIAFYAFYRIVMAAIRLLRGRKEKDPVFSAAKIIDFVFAVVALFTLQTAMLSTFDGDDAQFTAFFNSLSGIAASAFVLLAALYMLVRARREIAQAKEKD